MVDVVNDHRRSFGETVVKTAEDILTPLGHDNRQLQAAWDLDRSTYVFLRLEEGVYVHESDCGDKDRVAIKRLRQKPDQVCLSTTIDGRYRIFTPVANS